MAQNTASKQTNQESPADRAAFGSKIRQLRRLEFRAGLATTHNKCCYDTT